MSQELDVVRYSFDEIAGVRLGQALESSSTSGRLIPHLRTLIIRGDWVQLLNSYRCNPQPDPLPNPREPSPRSDVTLNRQHCHATLTTRVRLFRPCDEGLIVEMESAQ